MSEQFFYSVEAGTSFEAAVREALAAQRGAVNGVAPLDDARLLPILHLPNHKARHAAGGTDPLTPADIGAAASTDAGLSDARTPTAHRASHAVGGTDAVTPTDIGAIAASQRGVAGGVATLDAATGKLVAGQIPDTVVGAVDYQGAWNAATNTPALDAAGTGRSKGDYYVVSVGGATNLAGKTDWEPKDWIVWNGAAWEFVDNTDSVTSVFGRRGGVLAQNGDYTAAQVGAAPAGHVGSRDGHPVATSTLDGLMAGADKSKLDGIAPGGGSPDASATVKGIARVSVAPADPAIPIAVGTNDPRVTDPEAPIAPTLLNGWTNFGGEYATAAYYKDRAGRVHLRGVVQGGTAGNAAANNIFVLPAGYRPPAREMFTAVGGGSTFAVVNVLPTGEVRLLVGTTSFISLSSISLRVA